MAAWLEATQLAGFSVDEAKKLFPQPRGLPRSFKLKAQSPEEAAQNFLRRFHILSGVKAD